MMKSACFNFYPLALGLPSEVESDVFYVAIHQIFPLKQNRSDVFCSAILQIFENRNLVFSKTFVFRLAFSGLKPLENFLSVSSSVAQGSCDSI